jgi:DNA-binding response OmpR family regulator
MLTARGQQKDRDMAIETGANRFMTKPFANRDVRDALNTLIAQ